jgi:hypothetical protein
MHPAAKLQFERTAREFAQWRAVPEEDRSPAPAWWWQPAIDVVAQHEEMGALLCYRLQVSVGSTYAAGAAVLMGALADQTSFALAGRIPPKAKSSGYSGERLARTGFCSTCGYLSSQSTICAEPMKRFGECGLMVPAVTPGRSARRALAKTFASSSFANFSALRLGPSPG